MDQRRFPRANYKCVVTLRQEGKPATVSTVTENVGMGGICVLLDKSFDIFSTVELELSLEDGNSPVLIQGTVVWVVRRRDVKKGPSFDTGVEFSDLSTEDKARLEAVVDKALSKKRR
ncbi:MAG: PilZ domain-containing protein [Candidatus Omnitrophica bacterium]|nr:PilZ domain-containing protein [Candidatus Omnitrophota bacterium]